MRDVSRLAVTLALTAMFVSAAGEAPAASQPASQESPPAVQPAPAADSGAKTRAPFMVPVVRSQAQAVDSGVRKGGLEKTDRAKAPKAAESETQAPGPAPR